MTVPKSAKGVPRPPRIVAVVAAPAELQRAQRLRALPDFFELRLDALWPQRKKLQSAIASLRAPLIITARHPREGGRRNLSAEQRRSLLLEFLPHAAYVDVELRAARELRSVLAQAPRRIISVHQTNTVPLEPEKLADKAAGLGADIFKLVARTDTAAEVDALLRFFEQNKKRLPLCLLGVGRFGKEARRQLARAGSVLNYVHLGAAIADGQLSLAEMRRLAKSLRIV